MMGHREKLVGGEEWDMLCRRSRRMLHTPAGRARAAKRKFNRRIRRLARQEARCAALGGRDRECELVLTLRPEGVSGGS